MSGGWKRFGEVFKSLLYWFRRRWIISALFFPGLIFFYFSLPDPLFSDPYSTIIEDRSGELLSGKIAADGQWRFPEIQEVPEKFSGAITGFEDKRFFYHPGFDPISFFRAVRDNISSGKVVSGGSTISMQVIRLSRKGKSRTIFEKLYEIILAIRLELRYSKKEILALYSSHAPFGGNVVGLEAASWRYFGRSPGNLSWSESAALAVLPNSPALIYPGRNESSLLAKRNKLLQKLFENGKIDAMTFKLALTESLPLKPLPLPRLAAHLLERAIKEGHSGRRVSSTLEKQVQSRVIELLGKHHQILSAREIHNASALVLEVRTGNVLGYVGNVSGNGEGNEVDVITAPRSTGSILKPLLFAAMLNDGLILPNTLVPDIPTQISGYQPRNFNLSYDGAVPAKNALARSLNIPAVKMLQSYGVAKFHHLLKKLGISTLRFHPDHYGLSLILGGGEASLWEISGIYGSIARSLNGFNKVGRYSPHDFHAPNYLLKNRIEKRREAASLIDAGSAWLTFEAIQEVNRPDEDGSWRFFSSGRRMAWKTGTSFGFRDGWAIGTTPEFVVGVWAGNADGEGRPELTGISAAAPLMFDIYSSLPATTWFEKPLNELVKVPVCKRSGHRALDICSEKTLSYIQRSGLKTGPCPYHQLVHLDVLKKFRVSSECEDVQNMVHETWFVLPPAMEWYYRRKDISYQPLPPVKEGCGAKEQRNMEFIYPREMNHIYLPDGLDGKPGKLVVEVAHRRPASKIYWHLDDSFISTTSNFHQLSIHPSPGKHKITAVDQHGESVSQEFEILMKE